MTPAEILAMCRDIRPEVAEAGRLLAAQMRLPRKVLVTDLDGTLWEGVVAEGATKPRWGYEAKLRAVVDHGGLLAVATWNSPEGLSQMFGMRCISETQWATFLPVPMPTLLAPHDFAAIETGYDPKPAMIRRIAERLNLSVDSFVFVDDDPMQRAHVAQELPGVVVLTPDDDPAPYFEPVTLTDEDRHRAQMYEEEKERERAREAAPDRHAFLRSLGMRIRIERCRPEQRARVVQLLERTTQFNLTGWRDDGWGHGPDLTLVASVADRFGDCGLVGALICAEADYGRYWRIWNLVVSCRVLGRGVETALLRSFVQRVREEMEVWPSGPLIEGSLIATDRNAPAHQFFAQHGFTASTEQPGIWFLRDLDLIPASDHAAEIEDIP